MLRTRLTRDGIAPLLTGPPFMFALVGHSAGESVLKRPPTRNVVDVIKQAICDIETAVRYDTQCQLSPIAAKLGRKPK